MSDWGVWCERTGGMFGYAAAWLKEDGEEWSGTEEEALAKTTECIEITASPNVRYVAELRTASWS